MRLREQLDAIVAQLHRIEKNIVASKETEKNRIVKKAGKKLFGTVTYLRPSEYRMLVNSIGADKADKIIANYDQIKAMKGYIYASDYAAIQRWGIEAYNETVPRRKKSAIESEDTIDANREEAAWRAKEW